MQADVKVKQHGRESHPTPRFPRRSVGRPRAVHPLAAVPHPLAHPRQTDAKQQPHAGRRNCARFRSKQGPGVQRNLRLPMPPPSCFASVIDPIGGKACSRKHGRRPLMLALFLWVVVDLFRGSVRRFDGRAAPR